MGETGEETRQDFLDLDREMNKRGGGSLPPQIFRGFSITIPATIWIENHSGKIDLLVLILKPDPGFLIFRPIPGFQVKPTAGSHIS